MSTVFRRGASPYWYVGIPTRSGAWVKQSARTRDRSVAKAIARTIDRLRDKHERALLDAVCTGQLSVAELYAADVANDLEGLKARLADVDLAQHLTPWLADVASRLSPDTRYRYELHVSGLIAEGTPFPRSSLTPERIVAYLGSRKGGRSTKRRVHAALSSFCEYLADTARVLPRNPMRDVKAPAAARPRDRYLETVDQARARAKAQSEPYRTLSLLLHATGMEVSVAVGGTELPGGLLSEGLRRRDVDVARREIRVRGTKSGARDRIAKVAERRARRSALTIISSAMHATPMRCERFARERRSRLWPASSATRTRQWWSRSTVVFTQRKPRRPLGNGPPPHRTSARGRPSDSGRDSNWCSAWCSERNDPPLGRVAFVQAISYQHLTK